MPYLSIVVPFYDSAGTCAPLLQTLSSLGPEDEVELILVDDGSTDATPRILREFARRAAGPVKIIERRNGGPGAARNSGLAEASGDWVWFVDSDDTIDLRAIEVARSAGWPNVDLIAWNFEHSNIRRQIAPGVHETSSGPAPALDPVVANWFSRKFLQRTGLRFPENCIYEATPIEAFALPLLVSRFLASDFTAYRVSAGRQSVTRGHRGPRFYDRLLTVALGMDFIAAAKLEPGGRARFEADFIRLFLWYSIRLSTLPGPSWIEAARVMRAYRDQARRFGISEQVFDHYPGRTSSRLVLRLLWLGSKALPPQDTYFARLRRKAWERPICWTPPALPGRWT